MMRAAWSTEGAEAFARACADLDTKGATLAEIAELARGMKMMTFYNDGEPIGAVVIHESGAHIAILPQWRSKWLNTGTLQALRGALLHASRAMIAHSNDRARNFAKRMNWHEIGNEGNYVVYAPRALG